MVLRRVPVPQLHQPRDIERIEVVLPLRDRKAFHAVRRHRFRAVRAQAVPCHRARVPRLDYPVQIDFLAVSRARVIPRQVHRGFHNHVPCLQLWQPRDFYQAPVPRRPPDFQPVPSIVVRVGIIPADIGVVHRAPEYRLDIRIDRNGVRAFLTGQPLRVRRYRIRKRVNRSFGVRGLAFGRYRFNRYLHIAALVPLRVPHHRLVDYEHRLVVRVLEVYRSALLDRRHRAARYLQPVGQLPRWRFVYCYQLRYRFPRYLVPDLSPASGIDVRYSAGQFFREPQRHIALLVRWRNRCVAASKGVYCSRRAPRSRQLP